MNETKFIAPSDNGGNITGNNQCGSQDNTSTYMATQNNTGRPNNTKNSGKIGSRDQPKFKGHED